MIAEPEGATERCSLFVYGTLRRGFELHYHLARLGARFRRRAKVAAGLSDRGRYPGARPSRRRGEWVCGELYQLRQPSRDLRVLDEVEGFIPGAPERSLFVRSATELVLPDGSRDRAWIYWLGGGRVQGGFT
jgi:gamma-glutamylcyclotransferase (GGCT)/AIG2-like uncharacterized protein YtfP